MAHSTIFLESCKGIVLNYLDDQSFRIVLIRGPMYIPDPLALGTNFSIVFQFELRPSVFIMSRTLATKIPSNVSVRPALIMASFTSHTLSYLSFIMLRAAVTKMALNLLSLTFSHFT